MSTAKLTIHLGEEYPNVTVAAGTAIAGSDAMELNMDITKMTKGQMLILMEQLDAYLTRSKFPPI
jgi:hypothetical protein